MLTVRQLDKTYGAVSVLQGVDFALEPGSFTTILGASGAGKTTLFRCILRLTPADRGTVLLGDQDLTHCSPQELRRLRSHIAPIAQQFNLVRRRTALENCLGGRLSELPLWRCLTNQFPRALQREALAALERVQLLDHAFQRADHLSGGQQQRVAIARALTQRARLILADEPVASLDPTTARSVLHLLRSLCKTEGITVLCNLHQVELAREFSDRILGMRSGAIGFDRPAHHVQDSDLAWLYQRDSPRSTF
ncbi:phosphonate ABC transporter ATP-binding protein [Spirulina major CS-329]|uniref:phosphonate ABC transporter ATP-binding protein n=1 Tax=Spirulina TaxID=1154 RepID=UPI00232CAFD5|nr:MULTISPECIES: phosphonate ABC transporter ATP-binding protein [Spirulina]MDB9496760.1 phosphonate ABC transporter ATP-binding protein [Spirulina subsalsa CS-330]MDB9504180.1 phosphonate ABC transporter ATP-binding protein [Spirulina major CS-329]